jgi:hypothetical protein
VPKGFASLKMMKAFGEIRRFFDCIVFYYEQKVISFLYNAGYICDINTADMKRFLLFGLLALFVIVSCGKSASVRAIRLMQ